MEKDNTEQSTQVETKLLHIQVVDGSAADIYDIGDALKKFKKTAKLPYRIEFIISDDKVSVRDLDTLIQQLMDLKRQIKHEERMS